MAVTDRPPTGRPGDGEFADYARTDIDAVPGDDALRALASGAATVLALLDPLEEATVSGRLGGLPAEAWLRRGIVNGYSASARGLAFHIVGHELHHLRVLHERYRLDPGVAS